MFSIWCLQFYVYNLMSTIWCLQFDVYNFDAYNLMPTYDLMPTIWCQQFEFRHICYSTILISTKQQYPISKQSDLAFQTVCNVWHNWSGALGLSGFGFQMENEKSNQKNYILNFLMTIYVRSCYSMICYLLTPPNSFPPWQAPGLPDFLAQHTKTE
jgi:hypothetical protein